NATAFGIEDFQGEPVEPAAEVAVGAVPDDDGFDGHLTAEIDLPPRIGRTFLRVRLPAGPVRPILVAIDGPCGLAAVSGVLLRRFALPGDVAAVAEDFDFGQRQCPLPARQLDANIAAKGLLAAGLR